MSNNNKCPLHFSVHLRYLSVVDHYAKKELTSASVWHFSLRRRWIDYIDWYFFLLQEHFQKTFSNNFTCISTLIIRVYIELLACKALWRYCSWVYCHVTDWSCGVSANKNVQNSPLKPETQCLEDLICPCGRFSFVPGRVWLIIFTTSELQHCLPPLPWPQRLWGQPSNDPLSELLRRLH